MGFYTTGGSTVSLEGAGIVECTYENMMEASLNIVAESEYNYAQIMKHVGVTELAVYESTGVEMEYVTESADGFFAKIKEFFVRIWEKIKGLFKKFFAMLDVYAKSDKEFATKYKKDLFAISHSLKDFKYKGFEYTIDGKEDVEKLACNKAEAVFSGAGCFAAYETISDSQLESLKKAREDKEELVEKARGAVAGGGSQTASEFSKELFMLFRKNEETKQEIENPDINKMVNELEASAKAKSAAEKAFKGLEKTINDIIKAINKHGSDIVKKMPEKDEAKATVNQNALTAAQVQSSFYHEVLNIGQAYNGALLTAIKDNGRQNKAVCASLLSYKPKKESGTEGWQHESSFLGGVKLK